MVVSNIENQRNFIFAAVTSLTSAMTAVRRGFDAASVDKCDLEIQNLEKLICASETLTRNAGHWLAEQPVTLANTTRASTAFAVVDVARKLVYTWSAISSKLVESPGLWQELRPLLEEALPTELELSRVEPNLQIELSKQPSSVNVSRPPDVILWLESREALPEGFYGKVDSRPSANLRLSDVEQAFRRNVQELREYHLDHYHELKTSNDWSGCFEWVKTSDVSKWLTESQKRRLLLMDPVEMARTVANWKSTIRKRQNK